MSGETTLRAQVENARQYLRQGHGAYAAGLLKNAISAGAASGETYELLGMALAMSGSQAAARKAFGEATRMTPQRVSAHYNFAVLLEQMDELDEAAEENRTALLLDPGHAGAKALQVKLSARLKTRGYTSEEGFAVVGRGPDPTTMRSSTLNTLKCPTCGAMNHVTKRVCQNCSFLLPESAAIVAVE
jgi:tetratricopeptide (TPR) repeat protein